MTPEQAEISLAQRGLKLLYVPGDEPEAKLITRNGADTGLAIQFAGSRFVATEYRQGDGNAGSVRLGEEHRELSEALAECLAWHDLNGQATTEQARRGQHCFPTFYSHLHVNCFNCDAELAGRYSDQGYPQGRGQFTQECGKCGLRTWYDLEDNGE